MQGKTKGPKPISVATTAAQRKILEQMAKSTRIPHSYVMRARIILRTQSGLSNTAIARELNCDRGTVIIWRARWSKKQPQLSEREQDVKESEYRQLIEAALSDEARSGRPADFTAEQLCQIIAVAVREPQEYGCPVTHWTPKELAQVVIREGIVSTISPRHIGRFLKGVRPETTSVTVLAQQQARRGTGSV